MPPPARLERDGDVAELVLASPPLNLFDAALFDAIGAALGELERAPARTLLFRAEGDVFTAGVDVHVFAGLDAEAARALTDEWLGLTHRVEALPFPTIAVVHGLCLTAGLELSLACDLLWAAEGARFGLVEAVVGITPLMGGTQRMAERAGSARAREFVMTGDLYPAERLEQWGVVNRVVAPDDLLTDARRIANELAAGPTLAHAATKAVVRAQADAGTRGADDRVADLTSHLFDTDDVKRAVETFLREGPGKASFTGN